MSKDTPKELVGAAFTTEDGASQAFSVLKQLQKDDAIKIDAYAVVSQDKDGSTHVRDTRGEHAKWGGLVGAMIGLLAGPAGASAGAVAGAAVGGSAFGALWGALDGNAAGIPNDVIADIENHLRPASSAIVAVVDHKWVDRVEKELDKTAKRTKRHRIGT